MREKNDRTEKSVDGPYAPAVRLGAVRRLLESPHGVTLDGLAEHFGVSRKTAGRYLSALRESGEPVFDEYVDRRKIWRLLPTARRTQVSLTTSQMLSLFLSRQVFDFLAGTGLKEDLDAVFQRLASTLRSRDASRGRNWGKKIFDLNEAPHAYEGRGTDVRAILDALVTEEQLEIVYEGSPGKARRLVVDPYTLLVYKKGLYLVGASHAHGSIRTFALDSLRAVSWRRGHRFVYPADYDPAKLNDGAFGLFRGQVTEVRLFFSERVARFVARRRWHPTQKVTRVAGGIEVRMTVAGTTELKSWVLGFGAEAEVREPLSLRHEIADELGRASDRYRRPDPLTSSSDTRG